MTTSQCLLFSSWRWYCRTALSWELSREGLKLRLSKSFIYVGYKKQLRYSCDLVLRALWVGNLSLFSEAASRSHSSAHTWSFPLSTTDSDGRLRRLKLPNLCTWSNMVHVRQRTLLLMYQSKSTVTLLKRHCRSFMLRFDGARLEKLCRRYARIAFRIKCIVHSF